MPKGVYLNLAPIETPELRSMYQYSDLEEAVASTQFAI